MFCWFFLEYGKLIVMFAISRSVCHRVIDFFHVNNLVQRISKIRNGKFTYVVHVELVGACYLVWILRACY